MQRVLLIIRKYGEHGRYALRLFDRLIRDPFFRNGITT
jgi:hypothetical protein